MGGGDDSSYAAPGGADEPIDLVITDQAELDAFWAEHTAGMATPPAPPEVDFQSDLLLASMLGEQNVEGYGIAIEHVAIDPDTGGLDVEVVEEEPEDPATAAAALTRPYDVVRAPRPAATDAQSRPIVAFRRVVVLRTQTVQKGERSCYVSPVVSAANQGHLLAFRDQRSWVDFWLEHDCSGQMVPPAIDFSRHMAIAYVAGQGSGVTDAEITRVLYDRRARVLYCHVAVARDDVATDAARNPFHIVKCRSVPGTLRLRLERAWPLRTLDRGETSGYRYGDPAFAGENLVLRRERRYRYLWREHTSHLVPPPPPPGVHFPHEMVLASFFGYWPTSGASIEIVRARLTWFGALRVDVVKRARPGPLPVVTNPFHLAATRMWTGPVFFVERPAHHTAAISAATP